MNIDLHTICPRCLIEASGAAFDLSDYMDRIAPDMRASSEDYTARLMVCDTCDKLSSGLCMACGCYVELRAYTAARHCPYEKW